MMSYGEHRKELFLMKKLVWSKNKLWVGLRNATQQIKQEGTQPNKLNDNDVN
jgi:hypothetical protein